MTRQMALEIINHLYGLEDSYMQAALDHLGEAALSDRAVEWIARRQREEQDQRYRRGEAVAAYQSQNPHLSWQECEEAVEREQPEREHRNRSGLPRF